MSTKVIRQQNKKDLPHTHKNTQKPSGFIDVSLLFLLFLNGLFIIIRQTNSAQDFGISIIARNLIKMVCGYCFSVYSFTSSITAPNLAYVIDVSVAVLH